MRQFIAAFLSAAVVLADFGSSFNYKELGRDWGESVPLCSDGREQSPIDLNNQADFADGLVEMHYWKRWGIPDPAPGHELGDDPSWTVFNKPFENTWPPLGEDWIRWEHIDRKRQIFQQGEFKPLQFHFHAPSEHTVNGEHYDAELHIEHKGCVFEGEGDEKRPLDNCDTITVLGIFLDAGGQSDESYEPNPFLESVFKAFDLAYTRSSTNLEPAQVEIFHITFHAFANHMFWAYDGSLTTPPCTEGVKWRVFKTPQKISRDQLDRFRKYLADDYSFANGNGNNREVQDINGRTIWQRDLELELGTDFSGDNWMDEWQNIPADNSASTLLASSVIGTLALAFTF